MNERIRARLLRLIDGAALIEGRFLLLRQQADRLRERLGELEREITSMVQFDAHRKPDDRLVRERDAVRGELERIQAQLGDALTACNAALEPTRVLVGHFAPGPANRVTMPGRKPDVDELRTAVLIA